MVVNQTRGNAHLIGDAGDARARPPMC